MVTVAASKGLQGPKLGHLIIDTATGGGGIGTAGGGAVIVSGVHSTAGTNNSRQGSVDGAMQKCGLCSLLSRLLRRAMCVGSRRGSGESYYQELAETNVSSNSLYFF